MSQIYSLDARFPPGEKRHSTAYSGPPSSPAKSHNMPDTHVSRETTTTKIPPSVKQSYPTTRSKPRSRSRSGQAPTTKHPTKRSEFSQQSKHSTHQSSLAPVSRNVTGDDVKSTKSGFSGHDAEPADGAQLGDLSKTNVHDLGACTGGRQMVPEPWFDDSVKSAKPKGGFYEVVDYREGLGPRAKSRR